MLFFLVGEAALGAATTARIIKTGQDVSYQGVFDFRLCMDRPRPFSILCGGRDQLDIC